MMVNDFISNNKRAAFACCAAIFFCFFLAPFPLKADTTANDTAFMEWRGGDTLRLHFSLTAGDVRLKPDYRVTAMPRLVSAASDTLNVPLDTVEFAGRRNRKYNDRAAVLEHLPRRAAVYAPCDTLLVDTLLRAKPWMRDTTLHLCIVRLFDGCCSLDTLADECVAQTRFVRMAEPVVEQAVEEPVIEEPVIDEPPVQLVAAVPVVPNNAAERLVREGESLLTPFSEYRPFDMNGLIPKGVAYVRFSMDDWAIKPELADNRRALDRLTSIMHMVEADSASRIVRIVIVGAASPDGLLDKNIRLAGRRADALAEYIAQHFDTTGITLETVNVGEGWGNLTALLRNLPDETLTERDELLRIIDREADLERREHLLRAYKGGKPFRKLLGMFDMQRAASIAQVFYETMPDTAAMIINDAMRLIHQGDYQAAVDLLEPLDDDRRYNALGTAYYMVGRKEEAVRCIERAAALGDTEAKENLKQLTKSNKQLITND